MKELREAVKAAYEKMERAHKAISDLGDDVTEEQVTGAEREFEQAEAEHRTAKEKLAKAERVAEAKRSLPVEPVEDTEPEKRTDAKVGDEPLVYQDPRQNREAPSFWRDLYYGTTKGDTEARDRLARHQQQIERTNPNSAAGQGGEFAPPVWLNQEWISLARAHRATADAVRSMPLPPNTNSINFPTVATGATTATQSDAGSVSSTDITTSSYTVNVQTIAGQQDISQQLLDRSIPGFDVVVFEELRGRYDINVDTQVIAGSGSGSQMKGIDNVSNINTTTFTSGSPTVALLYSKLAGAISAIHTSRFLAPNAIIMHPRRWAWILASLDSNNRPLVVPNGDAFNQVAALERVAPESLVGGMQGLPVIVDPNITTTNGASTTEDKIYVLRLDDLWLMEDTPRTRVLSEVLSGTLQVRLQLYSYLAFAVRYAKSINVISGTGLIAPSF